MVAKTKKYDTFTPGRQPMVSGMANAADRKYIKIEGNNGSIWLVADQPNAADNIYYWNPNDKHSEGFGGATLTFELVDGTKLHCKGPWHVGGDSLYECTGFDVRDKYLTFGVIAEKVQYDGSFMGTMVGILYKDADWTLGEFKRIEKMAQELANKLQKTVVYYSESLGGACQAHVDPE